MILCISLKLFECNINRYVTLDNKILIENSESIRSSRSNLKQWEKNDLLEEFVLRSYLLALYLME